MRIDAHQHFWRYDPALYPWIGTGMEVLARDWLPGDLGVATRAAGISGTIAVQARSDVDETRWLLGLARESALVRGVVGWVDLESPELDPLLEELIRDAAFKGVRHVLQDEPDDAHMLRANFKRGLGRLATYGLAYDLLIHPRHLANAAVLVAEFPEQTFVLDHLAKPLIKSGVTTPWRADLAKLARFPNVTCKLSGLVTEADHARWKPADLAPYLDAALEEFGPARLMFGSDWPVCTLAGSYEQVHAAIADWSTALSRDEQAQLFGGTAARVYSLA